MDKVKDGWFSEDGELWPGVCTTLKVEEILYKGKSKFQDILVFKTKTFGTVLVLDGAIQCTEKDEFTYQEMITFLPLNCHQNPKKVLIVGGGDGGVAREVIKHPSVESVIQCEIDEEVIEVSKKYLPFMASSYSSPKLTLHVGDGLEFVGKHKESFDVIITDSSDPVGPAQSLFEASYYDLLKKALRPGGIICCQCQSIWFDLKLIKQMIGFCKTKFPSVSYAYTTTPTYPGGSIGFLLCSISPDVRFSEPIVKFSKEDMATMNLRYYNGAIHKAAFSLPQFVLTELADEQDKPEEVKQ